ncbi:MAG: glycosyltransferase family 4 protein [Proteobacteria bacterium]|nr:glycosyltransferase family 4 protein [Pseudomonadota bacterium]
MNILHVVRQFSPAIGGLEAYVKNMAVQQKKLGHKCTVLTLDKIFHSDGNKLVNHEFINEIEVYRVPFIGKQKFFIPIVAPSFFKKFDIIHVHNTDVFFDYISLISFYTKKPIFTTTHGGFFHTKDLSRIKKYYFNLITKKSCKRYNAIFAISKNDYNIFQGTNKNLLLKHNAIAPLGNFIASGQDFIYIGRLSKHKNVNALISTFAELKSEYSTKGKLHIIGPEWDVTREELSKSSQKLDVENDVVIYGFVADQDMEKILKKCGYFLSASSFEGFGMSMLEAMSVGLIPFVQPNESFSDLVNQGNIGNCVDFTNSKKAASQINNGIEAITEEQRLAAQEFAAKFSWHELAQATIDSYKEYS